LLALLRLRAKRGLGRGWLRPTATGGQEKQAENEELFEAVEHWVEKVIE
jgi:hypothetical protein